MSQPYSAATPRSAPGVVPTSMGPLIELGQDDQKVYKQRYFALKHLVHALEDENNMLALKLAQITTRCRNVEISRRKAEGDPSFTLIPLNPNVQHVQRERALQAQQQVQAQAAQSGQTMYPTGSGHSARAGPSRDRDSQSRERSRSYAAHEGVGGVGAVGGAGGIEDTSELRGGSNVEVTGVSGVGDLPISDLERDLRADLLQEEERQNRERETMEGLDDGIGNGNGVKKEQKGSKSRHLRDYSDDSLESRTDRDDLKDQGRASRRGSSVQNHQQNPTPSHSSSQAAPSRTGYTDLFTNTQLKSAGDITNTTGDASSSAAAAAPPENINTFKAKPIPKHERQKSEEESGDEVIDDY